MRKSFYFSLLLTFSGLFLANFAFSQTADTTLPTINYATPSEFEIGGLRVSGAKFSDANALLSISGLKVGDKLRIPGQEITRSMRTLWNLKLFTDVQIIKERTQGNIVFLEIAVVERPRYSRHAFKGVKKSQHDDLNTIISKRLLKGAIVTDNSKAEITQAIQQHFIDKGFLDSKVKIKEFKDEKTANSVRLDVNINRGKKVKIKSISFTGNEHAKARKLAKKMKNTKTKVHIFSGSKLIKKDYEEDKIKMLNYYSSLGFRDAKIKHDTVWRGKKGLNLKIDIEEGNRYFFRNIAWKGNTIYENSYLNQVLGINKGDVFNQDLLDQRLKFAQDGRDISSLYLDNGYLFFNCDPVEVSVEGDSIDLEMRIYEGPQATIDRVTINGNDRTHDHVVRRELYTRPGDKFSRSDIIRSQREIINLGYFNPEALGINTPVNPQRGTVDIDYTVEEKPSDQLELSAGYQPKTIYTSKGSVIGTLGVTFNNFSIRNITKKSSWNPLPQGDGQRLSIRAQSSGERYQSYNMSFTEPWMGGRKPNSLTVAAVYNRFNVGYLSSARQRFEILQGSVGFGTRLKVPDDNFVFRSNLEMQQIRLQNYAGFFDKNGNPITNGRFNNLSVDLTLARNSVNDPLFPKNGSSFSLTGKLTPPYSLLGSKKWKSTNSQEAYKFIEYMKWRFDAEWYTTLVGKLVFKSSAKMGILSAYNKQVGLSPFERYELGGDGLSNQGSFFNGREILSSRGYEVAEFSGNGAAGAAVFNKYTLELRYPISLNPSSTIYALGFAQAANAWSRAKDWTPFDLKRSAGVGLRVFLPMFGTLGFDYGVGFDKPELYQTGARKLTSYGKFNIILGFEPD
jgi:outer membrane protein insertion porin family